MRCEAQAFFGYILEEVSPLINKGLKVHLIYILRSNLLGLTFSHPASSFDCPRIF